MTPRCADLRVARIVSLFETLRQEDIARLGQHYAPEVWFKDPFNEVVGVQCVQAIFEHMFATLDAPQFVVHDIIVQGDHCMLTWDFRFRFKRYTRQAQTVRGASHLQLNALGLIVRHRDYWDAAEELYEKLPVVNVLMRWLKRSARP